MRSLFLFGVVTLYMANSIAMADSDDEISVTRSLSYFTGNFVKNAAEGTTGNLICSPIGASMILSMATFGARGNTERQLRMALNLPQDDSVIKRGFQSIVDNVKRFTAVDLRLANKIFVGAGYTLKPNFKDVTQTYFRSAAQSLNFGSSVAAAKAINDWAAAETNNRIKDLVKSSTLNSNTALVLVNAVYFKGSWNNKFDSSETKSRPFHVNGNTVKNVPTMHRNGTFEWGALPNLKATYVKLPYKQSDDFDGVSMYVILPNNIGDFAHLKKNLDKIDPQSLYPVRRAVDLYLPKFKIENEVDLKETLRKMRLTVMLTDAADFSGIARGSALKISNVVQKAFVEVNEEGSEAAAATQIGLEDRWADDEDFGPIAFVVDRPFVSVIATDSGLSLFNAIVTDPTIV